MTFLGSKASVLRCSDRLLFSWDVRNLLEVFSREYTHKDFCLAHLFTDIKFEGGILGLAYVGSPRRNSVGGICTPEYFKNGYTLYLNSGLSSSRSADCRSPPVC